MKDIQGLAIAAYPNQPEKRAIVYASYIGGLEITLRLAGLEEKLETVQKMVLKMNPELQPMAETKS